MMKKFFAGLLLLGLTFTGAFYLGKARQQSPITKCAPLEFKPSPYPLFNHPFVVVIVGTNNGAWLERTLGSVFRQNYPNFRMIYIDNASDDGSYDLARDLIYESTYMEYVTLLRNESQLGITQSYARAIATCEPHEIVVVLGGEDWFAHEWVLSKLNQYYANPDLWVTYGGCREYPNYAMSAGKRADPTTQIRKQPFFASSLQSFYADLFQRIAPEDLIYPAAVQQAYMLPLLEMAGEHAGCISDVLYIANKLGTKENPEMALLCEKSIRSLSAYSALTKRSIASGTSEERITEEAQ